MPAKTCIFNQEIHSMAIISQDAIKLGCSGGQGKIQIQTFFERANQLILQLSRILYKSTLFYAKQTQFPKKSNERKYIFTDGL